MISLHNKYKVIQILDSVLGAGKDLKENERVHYCPFCHHAKMKMNVNVETGKFHCWVCDAKGTRIYSLLKQLNVEGNVLHKITEIYGNDYITIASDNEPKIELRLPVEFVSLTKIDNSFNPIYKRAMFYLKKRGITPEDIIKYNIGYCKTGLYAGRLIIPSYDEHGTLNYFIARTVFDNEDYKYKNPPVSKDIVALGNQINWNSDVVISEGIFDAMAIKRNVIPIFGKYLSKQLQEKIIMENPPNIIVCLDNDAIDGSIKIIEFLLKHNINVKFVNLPKNSDPSEVGFSNITKLIRDAKHIDFSSLISLKIGLI